MSKFDGVWKTVTRTPIGDQPATLTLSSDGKTLTGTNQNAMGTIAVENGVIDGDSARWTMRMMVPMPMTLEAEVTVDGDTLTGTIKAGMFGKSQIAGTRQG